MANVAHKDFAVVTLALDDKVLISDTSAAGASKNVINVPALTAAQVAASATGVPGLTAGNLLLDAAGAALPRVTVDASSNSFAGAAGNTSLIGSFNAGFGSLSLSAVTSGLANATFGPQAGQRITSGGYNALMGFRAGTNLTSGNFNAAFGNDCFFTATTAGQNTHIGFKAGYLNLSATGCTGVGYQALYTNTASYCTAVGADAMFANTTGVENTAIGRQAMTTNTTGTQNTGVGNQVLLLNTTGSGNSGFGAFSLGHNTTGINNTGVGRAAGWYNTTGANNTSIGYRSGYGNNSGSSGVSIGYYAGHNTLVASSNTFIGTSADYFTPAATMVATASAGAGLTAGTYAYRVAFVLDSVETGQIDSSSSSVVTSGGNLQVSLSVIPVYTGPKTCTARKIYRTPKYVSTIDDNLYYLVTTIADNTTTTYVDSTPDVSLGAAPPAKTGSIAFGAGALVYKDGQFVVGSNSARITEVFIGGGVDETAPAAVTLAGSGGSGTNIAGAAFRIAGGMPSGSGAGGKVILSTAPAGASGTAARALVDVLELLSDGYFFIKNATTIPGSNPSGGGNLYVESGDVKWRTSAGTISSLSPAQPVAVASLPSASTYAWSRASVNNASMTHTLGVGNVVVGGGGNSVPVYSDGTNWRIG